MPLGLSPLTVETRNVTGGESVTFNIPNDYNVAMFGLRVSGSLVIGTANATALQNGGAANVIKRVRISAKGEQRLDILGKELLWLNKIHNQSSGEQTDPGLTVGTHPFAVTLLRQFQMPRMVLPLCDRGILPNNIIRDVQVVVDIGDPSDVVKPDTTTTLAFSGLRIEFFVIQAVVSPVDPNFYITEQVFSATRDTNLLTSTGDKEITLNVGGKYRHIILYTENTANSIAARDDIISQVVLKSNRTEIVRQSWYSLKADNRVAFLLTSAIPGVAVLDFTRFFSPQELLDADKMLREGSDLRLAVTVANAAANSIFGVVGVRLFDNPKQPLLS